ncbi:MAG TPA: GNAT family N-acetyltransferase [Candidatus Omnitrophota bacterium]|jgi:GNAT superfamily N-acetyltransferase|nr:GNAT family N-acetyltransferase [Candidatus Omnitrophota bacterium]
MANALNRALGVDVDSFTADRVREDAFGPEPLVSILMAEMDGRAAGYAFYHTGYDSDLPARSLVVVDLYVDPEVRGRGLGQALMAGLAREAVRLKARSMTGGVLDSNMKALAFYRSLGAVQDGVRFVTLREDALRALAKDGRG